MREGGRGWERAGERESKGGREGGREGGDLCDVMDERHARLVGSSVFQFVQGTDGKAIGITSSAALREGGREGGRERR